MNCISCKNIELNQVITENGVLIDICPKCKGIWLDKGEIYLFSKDPKCLREEIEKALKNSKQSIMVNPITNTNLVELTLFAGKLVIDYCPKTQGVWLDKGELERLSSVKETQLHLMVDKTFTQDKMEQKSLTKITLPSLGVASGVTLFLLYGLVTLVLITLVNFGIFETGFAIFIGIVFAFLQFVFSPFIMDITLRWFYKVSWINYTDLPTHLKDFIEKVCTKNNMKLPIIGIIPDGSPNAFTYGHHPNNARIVITSGIMDLLAPHELEAVVAHEIGHAVHWDILIMTIAYVVPLVLYYIYQTFIRVKSRGKDNQYRYIIAIGAYILYIISQYIVLWFSRIREYYADRFSGLETKDPSSTASALVKIGYGLAGRKSSNVKERSQEVEEERKPQLEAIKALGLFDPVSARAFAVASFSPSSLGGEINKEDLKGAMRWDLWNPWAMYYELHSTHPLIAKRIIALSRLSNALNKEPYVTFDERRPESYWDEFFFDVCFIFAPIFIILTSFVLFITSFNSIYLKTGFLFFGITYFIKILFTYKSNYFPEMNISSLLKIIKVSGIRPVPCKVKGKIIGKGVPGLIWSEDFVLQDKTGIIFLDFRQPLAIWNFLFGLLKAGTYIGSDVTITGWYRRSPVPYIEIKSIDTGTKVSNCYTFHVKLVVSIILMIISLMVMFAI